MAGDNTCRITRPPEMRTQMLIRKPAPEVFEADLELIEGIAGVRS